jgi:thiamine biosynthesis lipoprotein
LISPVFAAPTLKSTNKALRLDFGAYAKGYAVDRGIEALRALGIKNAILNAGGDLRA